MISSLTIMTKITGPLKVQIVNFSVDNQQLQNKFVDWKRLAVLAGRGKT